MANMSYCRFRNTFEALQDCFDAWENEDADLSSEEKQAKERLLALCVEITQGFSNYEVE